MPAQIHLDPKSLLVIPHVRVRGGRRSTTRVIDRTDDNGAVKLTRETVVQIDNAEERKKAEDYAMRARNVARQFAAYTPLGYIAAVAARDQITAKVQELKVECDTLNLSMATCRVDVEVLLIEVALHLNDQAMRAITDHVREELVTLQTAIKAGATDARNVFNRVRNTASIATGVQADAIKYALDEAKQAIKQGTAQESTPALDNAVALFEATDPASIPEAI